MVSLIVAADECFQTPSNAGAVNMLHAATADEVKDKDITGKRFTPYGYVSSAPDATTAGNMELVQIMEAFSGGLLEICAWNRHS